MFLKKLYRDWPFLFWLTIVLLLGQIFFMFKAIESIPFFLFNMYSTPHSISDSSTYLRVYANDKQLDLEKLSGHEKEMLFGSLSYFEKLEKTGFRATDSATIRNRFIKILPPEIYRKAFARLTHSSVNEGLYWRWWQKYLTRVSGNMVDSFTIIRSSISWKPSYHRHNDSLSIVRYGNH